MPALRKKKGNAKSRTVEKLRDVSLFQAGQTPTQFGVVIHTPETRNYIAVWAVVHPSEVCDENPLHRKVSTEANDAVSKTCTVGPTESVKQYVCSGG